MPVLSPEREMTQSYRAGKWAAPPPPPRVYRRRRGFLGGAARVAGVILAVLLGWVGLHHVGDLIPGLSNPFGTEKVDRTGPAVLKALTDTPTGEQGLYAAAEPKLRAAADESALVAKADQNTTEMLQKFLGALGFGNVNVQFQENPA